MPKMDAASDEVAKLIEGRPELTFSSTAELATACKKLSSDAHALFAFSKQFADAAARFISRSVPDEKLLGGMLKNIRMAADDAHETRKVLDTAQKPMSIRTLVESLLSVRLALRAQADPEAGAFTAHGRKFVVRGSVLPTVPDQKRNPEERKILADYLRQAGRSDLIFEDFKHTELSEFFRERMEQITPEEWKNGKRPWPEALKVFIAPAITVSEDKSGG